MHCNTLQRTATHCNALQHTATHCNTLGTHKSIGINKTLVNPKSTSNQSSKSCTVLQYPSRKKVGGRETDRWCQIKFVCVCVCVFVCVYVCTCVCVCVCAREYE